MQANLDGQGQEEVATPTVNFLDLDNDEIVVKEEGSRFSAGAHPSHHIADDAENNKVNDKEVKIY